MEICFIFCILFIGDCVWVSKEAVSATIMKQHNPGLTDPQLRQLITAHIDDDSFCRHVIQQDIDKIGSG